MGRTNIHLYPDSASENFPTRILKETKAISRLGFAEKILILTFWREGLLEEEVVDETITIIRFKLWARKLGNGTIPRTLKFIEWSARVALKYLKTSVAMVNVHNLAVLPLGGIFKIFKRSKLIYDTHELEAHKFGWGASRIIPARFLEWVWIKLVDEIIVVSPSVGEWYERTYRKRPYTVLNARRYQPVPPRGPLRENLGISEHTTLFLYQGALAPGRAVENLIRAFLNIKDRSASIVFMGYGPLEDEVRSAAKLSDNIFFHPAVSSESLVEYSASADFGFALVENSCLNYEFYLGNKLFEYAMAGVPVIVPDVLEMRQWVEKHGIGHVIKDTSVEEIGSVIARVTKLQDPDIDRRIAEFNKVFNWEAQEQVLAEIYDGLSK